MDSAAPLSISWSSLRAHMECKAKAALLRSGKKSSTTDIRSYFHGTVVDRVMREWLSAPDPRPGEMVQMVEDLTTECERQALEKKDGVVRWRHKNDRAEMLEFCRELVARLEPILFERVLPHDYQAAKRFKVPVTVPNLSGAPEQIFLRGEMDLLVKDQLGFRVEDLKGTADDSYWRKTIGQLVFYDIALAALLGEYTHQVALIQPMCRARVLEFTVSETARQQMWSHILRMAADMWQRDAAPKADSKGCAICPVRHACPKYKAVELVSADRPLSLPGIGRVLEETSLTSSLGLE